MPRTSGVALDVAVLLVIETLSPLSLFLRVSVLMGCKRGLDPDDDVPDSASATSISRPTKGLGNVSRTSSARFTVSRQCGSPYYQRQIRPNPILSETLACSRMGPELGPLPNGPTQARQSVAPR
jgi:hypothetical protein